MSTETHTESGRTANSTTTTATETPGEETVTVAEDEDEDDLHPVEVVHAPSRQSQGIAIGAAVLGAALTAPFALLALPFGIAGVVIVAGSMLVAQSREWLTAGVGLLLFGSLITGAYGAATPELLLVGVGATIVAWDVGQHGIRLGDQLGRHTRSGKATVAHTLFTVSVVGGISTVSYLVYLVGTGGRPVSAVALVVLGIALVAWTLRR